MATLDMYRHVIVNTWDDKGQSIITDVPIGCHLVLMNDQLADQIFSRTQLGMKLTYTKGKMQKEGWYIPTITQEDDGYVIINEKHLYDALNELGVSQYVKGPVREAARTIFSFLRCNYVFKRP
jgi:hypothetical protein